MAHPAALKAGAVCMLAWWVALGFVACGNADKRPAAPLDWEGRDVVIQVDAAHPGTDVNRLILGSNVQWVDGGDNLLQPGTLDFDPRMQRLVEGMGPTVLRYPGGEQSDSYHWIRGMGSLSNRGVNLQAGTDREQLTYMGTPEILRLAQMIDAATLFTVNVATGTAAEAAAWVRQTNVLGVPDRDGISMPKVAYWEIGNEPYLPEPNATKRGGCQIGPKDYARRINAYAGAMRASDPGVRIGVALADDEQNGIRFVPATCANFAAVVLGGLVEPVDFISVHDAYLPYDPTGRDHLPSDEYWAAMASAESLQTDLTKMRALLNSFPKVRNLPFALTEFNALFSLNPRSAFIHSMASPMGALYVADVLRVLAARDDILMANTWSLSGNDHWGAIRSTDAGPRGGPTYEVMRLFGEVLRGKRAAMLVRSPTFDAPALGFSAAKSNLPMITTLATLSDMEPGARILRILILNKDLSSSHRARIEILGATAAAARASALTAANVYEGDDPSAAMHRNDKDLPSTAPLTVTMDAHSLMLVTVRLAQDASP